MNETTTQTNTIESKRDALRWFIDNRREDVSFEQAIKQLRFAMYGDRKAQAMLNEIAAAQAH
ncbi:hypothetical protein [Xenophilus sp.]|jgi:hypothetical protein|uniref:hypothetical protein n=1 Tax=Xenophilus sp. TaxID=1873499 RepID=UPI0037DCE816